MWGWGGRGHRIAIIKNEKSSSDRIIEKITTCRDGVASTPPLQGARQLPPSHPRRLRPRPRSLCRLLGCRPPKATARGSAPRARASARPRSETAPAPAHTARRLDPGGGLASRRALGGGALSECGALGSWSAGAWENWNRERIMHAACPAIDSTCVRLARRVSERCLGGLGGSAAERLGKCLRWRAGGAELTPARAWRIWEASCPW